jgi:hypothetical protein
VAPVSPRVPLTPAVPPAPPPTFVQGEHRVIVHTMEGHVKRGIVRDIDFRDDTLSLEQQAGIPPERIPSAKLKAVFFMALPGASEPQPKGKKIRVTFHDGRLLAGYSEDYGSANNGFFVVPADTRTNTQRIFIFRSSVQAITPG